jgi:diguanylate cyclase (GGDEF)-like protein
MRLCVISEIDDASLRAWGGDDEAASVVRYDTLDALTPDVAADVVLTDVSHLDEARIEGLRRVQPEVALVARVMDAAEGRASLVAGADGTCARDDDEAEVARVLEAALRARRARIRWPRSFAERRLLVVAAPRDAASLAEAAQQAGFACATVDGVDAALAALREVDPQVVLSQLGGDDTRELRRAVRCYDHGMGLVLVASHDEPARSLLDTAADALLVPPLDVDLLAAGLERGWMRWSLSRARPAEHPTVVAVQVPPTKRGALASPDGRWHVETARDGAEARALLGERAVACLVLDRKVALEDRLTLRALTDVPVVLWGSEDASDPSVDATIAADADADAAVQILERQVTQGQRAVALRTLSYRLHEVDARRMRLIQQVADAQGELERLETVDHVTETLNRRGLELVLERSLAAARRGGGSVAACLMDCDDFLRIEERFGRGAGDRVLRKVAERVTGTLRQSDVIGRVGVDTFLMLLPRTRLAEAGLVAERARIAVSADPLLIEDGAIQLSVSAGVVAVAWDTTSLDEVVAVAEVALAESKAAGKDRVSGGVDSVAASMDEMIAELVDGDALRAVAQPIVRLADQEIVAYEMLSRGRQGLFEAPEQFLRLSRERGVLTAVDLRCLRNCLAAAKRIPADHVVHVNLYPTTLLESSIEDLIRMLTDPDSPVCVELSEEQFVGDPRKLIDRVSALRAAGIRLAIDDVGKGRGTLDSVMLLEPELVKIDKDLTHDASRDVRKERLLRRLVALASALGAEVIAEGVESEADLGLLHELDVPLAQGFYWAKPEPYGEP